MDEPFTMLDELGADYTKLELTEVPETAEDVRRVFGSPLSQVLKTVVFINSVPVVAVLPGDREVDRDRLSSAADADELRLATPEEVRELTGKEIGSLDPFVRPDDCLAIVAADVQTKETVNMGGGKPGVGIEMDASQLVEIWDGTVENITR
jgi:prolyl-tRNA editing enzyme YbaK/EbsC (Cys-tRNA(Pro) deacylase)